LDTKIPERTGELNLYYFGHYFGREVAPKRNVFLGKNIADPTVKKSKK
jgi:hypothetical protein